MKAKTHITAAVTAGAGLCQLLQTDPLQTAGIVLAAGFGSLLPDIDSASSRLGRKTAPVSWIFTLIFGHRQMFHSLSFWLTVIVPLLFLAPAFRIVLLSVLIGISSHLLLDALNPSGIPPFWPFRYRLHLASIRCGGMIDFSLFLIFLTSSVFLIGSHITNLV